MHVIGVVGRRGSGKGVFAEVAREAGLHVFEMSDVVVRRMLKTKIIIDNRSLRLFANGLRKKRGADFIARKTIERVRGEARGKKAVVVVGIRSPAEVRALKKAFGKKNFTLVALSAPLRLRWARIKRRGRPEDARSFREFLWAEGVEEGWGLGKAMKMAGERMKNVGSKRDFARKASSFLRDTIGFYSPKGKRMRGG